VRPDDLTSLVAEAAPATEDAPAESRAESGREGSIDAAKLGIATVALTGGLALLALSHALPHVVLPANLYITDYFLMTQDLGVFACAGLLLLLICLPSVKLSGRQAQGLSAFIIRRGLILTLAAAVLVGVAAFLGWRLAYHAYPLSMDEFFASFQASIIRQGRLFAPVPPEWRAYVPALQPAFAVSASGNMAWGGCYLPVNAAFQAVFGILGSEALAGPFWAALSIVIVFSLGRRFWPDRPDAAFVSALLLATSSQLIVIAMTPYAMSAHLALNLLWLWLLVRKNWASQLGAAAVAFAATGLHQIIFHPLFAAPFVLQLWLERRWSRAAFHTAAYGAIGLFWMSYWPLAFSAEGLSPASASGVGATVSSSVDLFSLFDPADAPGQMGENLLRFVAWQNPLCVALGIGGVAAALRLRDRSMAPLIAGVALMLMTATLLMPFQGHGWGYRYLHGFLGSLSLLAGFAWTRFLPSDGQGRRQWAALAASVIFSLALALPLRLEQVSSFILPYARASAAIENIKADVVLVDPTGLWYGGDLIRNSPFLNRGPKVVRLSRLTGRQLQDLCGRYRVATFYRSDGVAFGVPTVALPPDMRAEALKPLLARSRCGAPVAGAAPGT
jgi:hypothetical protein